MVGIKKQREADQRGENPMYRPKGYRRLERINEKKEKKVIVLKTTLTPSFPDFSPGNLTIPD